MKLYSPAPAKTIPVLWTDKPETGDPNRHHFSQYTRHGRNAAAKRRVLQLFANQSAIAKTTPGYHYTHAVTVKILDLLTLPQHRELWSVLVLTMRKLGISAAWEREVTRTNKIDYHLVVRHAPDDLMKNRARKLRELLHKTTTVRLNIQCKPIPTTKDAQKWLNYVSKVKLRDTRTCQSQDVDIVSTFTVPDDIYARKRVFFRKPPKGQKLYVTGDFGGFFDFSPTTQTTAYRQKKKDRATKRQKNLDIEHAAQELAELTGLPSINIEDNLHAEIEAASNQAERENISSQNHELAVQYFGGEDEYADYKRDRAEQLAREQQRRLLLKQKPRTKKTKILPFDPSQIIESITT